MLEGSLCCHANVVHELTNVDNLNLLTTQENFLNVNGNKFA